MKISGNTILITGGATGIGLALAEQFTAKGNQVIICGRREDRLREAQQKLPDIHTRICDVAQPSERIALHAWATTAFPNLNVLINNAGVQRDFDFLAVGAGWETTQSEISINLDAPIHLSAMFVPHLRAIANPAIVNVSSGLAFAPSATFPIYCATKAAVHSVTMTMRHQLAKANIGVYEVIPPAVDSELNQAGRKKRGFQSTGTTAEEFAASVMEGLERDDDEIAYGSAMKGRLASRAELDEVFLRMNR